MRYGRKLVQSPGLNPYSIRFPSGNSKERHVTRGGDLRGGDIKPILNDCCTVVHLFNGT